jgi:sugar lactone lactonase YvrE
MRSLHTLLTGGAFFEGPRWRDGRWWVSDMFGRRVLMVDPTGRAEEVMTVEAQPSGLGWMPDGSLLVVSMKNRQVLRRSATGRVTVHADISAQCRGWANDMVVDVAGRAYVGSFGFDLLASADPSPANLVVIDPDGAVNVAADGLLFPNGSVLTPDGGTLIVGETFGARYTSFTTAHDGSLSDRRTWAQFGPTPHGSLDEWASQLKLAPDGCTLDAEGCIWFASTRSVCCRVAMGGEILDEIRVPDGLRVYACMLGGHDGRTLLMAAVPSFVGASRDPAAREAVLLTTTVDVPHAGLP